MGTSNIGTDESQFVIYALNTLHKYEENMKQVVFTTGRINPPTRGHEKLFKAAHELARTTSSDVRLFVTRSQDSKKNPLSVDQKLHFLKEFFPNTEFHTCVNAFTACRELAQEGYERAVLVVGEDRDGDLIKGLKQYINHPDPEKSIGLKDVDTYVIERTSEDYSATQARKLAAEGNFEAFSNCVPEADPSVIAELYDAVRQGLGIRDGGNI